jgi:type II secretory ATPase GspE/PulE/Tfp pilus assembly ATPase PilB-like protein
MDVPLFTAKGCEQCVQGYYGRTGIFELLQVTPELTALILKGCHVPELNQYAQAHGMQSLQQSALMKVRQGIISPTEMQRIV